MDKRIIELESRLAFMDEMVEQLNDAVIHQQQQIERLEVISRTLAERLRGLSETPDSEQNPADEVPPHY